MFLDEATGAFRSRLIRAMKNLEVIPRLELAPLSTEAFIHDAPDLWPVHAAQAQTLERASLSPKSFPVIFRTSSTSALIVGVATPADAPSALIGMRPVGTSSVVNLWSRDFGVPVA
jgi:hypothetical protein